MPLSSYVERGKTEVAEQGKTEVAENKTISYSVQRSFLLANMGSSKTAVFLSLWLMRSRVHLAAGGHPDNKPPTSITVVLMVMITTVEPHARYSGKDIPPPPSHQVEMQLVGKKSRHTKNTSPAMLQM